MNNPKNTIGVKGPGDQSHVLAMVKFRDLLNYI